MKITLYDVFGGIMIEGEYDSLIDCIVKNKHNMRYADLSDKDFKHVNCRYFNFDDADFRNANFYAVSFYNANFRNSTFRNANFYDANFCKADFRKVDFTNSNFNDVIFSYANFSHAAIGIFQLYEANCVNTKLDHELIKIQGSRDLFCYYNGEIKIGCECHPIEKWLEHGPFTNEYTLEQQEEYMGYIKMVNNLYPFLKKEEAGSSA